jgi:diacylglycerol O-acyltransferase
MTTDAGTPPDHEVEPQPVRGVDAAFLHNETRSTPWHIVGVLVFDPSTGPGGFDRDTLARVVADRIEGIEAFRRRLVDVPGRMSLPHWTHDRTVDLSEHIRSLAMPALDGLKGLAKLAAETATTPVRRDRPLWEMSVIDDVGGGRAAIVAKVHHSIMDGAAAVGILGALFDLEPKTSGSGPVDTSSTGRSHGLPVAPMLRTIARMPVVTARTIAHMPAAAVGLVRAFRDAGRSVTLPLTGPRTTLNRSITANRAVALTTLPLPEVKEVAEAFDLTINDVLTATCAGALRTWLDEAGELPDKPLIAAVPVAVRSEGTHQSGNKVSVMFVSFPTHLAAATDRLAAVKQEMSDAKATHKDIKPKTLGALAEAAPWNLVGLLFRAYSDLGLANRLPPAVNLVFSNVPGPPVPVFCGGAQLVGLYPLGPIFDGAALNLTVATCNDDVDVGVVTCPDVAPPLDGLVDALRASLTALVALARLREKPGEDAT